MILSSSLIHPVPKAACSPWRPGGSLDVVNPAEWPGWNDMILSHPEGSAFHSAEWMTVLAKTYSLTPVCLMARRDDQTQAVVPVMEVKGLMGGRKGVSLPFTDICEPLLWEAAERSAVWEGLLGYARARSWKSVELRGGGALVGGNCSISYYGHTLKLDQDEEALFERLQSSARRAVRKAQREGVCVAISTDRAAMSNYYDLHCLTRRRHGLPPQPFAFFENILEQVIRKGNGIIVTASHQKGPIAAAIFLRLGRKAIFKFGASDKQYQGLRGNDLVMWEAIRWLTRQGCATLDFGRTDRSAEGLRRFKRGWGAEEFEVNYARYDLRKSRFVTVADRVCGWHTAFFRILPIWLSRAIGSMIYGRCA
jgi:hypothetical protein